MYIPLQSTGGKESLGVLAAAESLRGNHPAVSQVPLPLVMQRVSNLWPFALASGSYSPELSLQLKYICTPSHLH